MIEKMTNENEQERRESRHKNGNAAVQIACCVCPYKLKEILCMLKKSCAAIIEKSFTVVIPLVLGIFFPGLVHTLID
uniref:Uncharacterized protein n=1 Tax=Romanomermis culicivorax TaxID=13658 RepID=A0A915HW53_ROMCU